MVRIRMTRKGGHKRPFYRIIVCDSRIPRDGAHIEQIGYYDPMKQPPVLKIDLARVDHWVGVGAKPSDTVGHLIAKAKALVPAEAS